ncbi:MAG: disulfide bond formation protein B [Candidatus Paceibacterota bacterium]
MNEIISMIFSWGTLFAHIFIVIFVLFLLIRNSLADKIISFVGEHVLFLSFLVSLGGLIGSLVYSEVVGFTPCVLCWVQRLFLFPQVVLFGSALLWKDKNILRYTYRLSVLGALVGAYHAFTNLGGKSLTPCTSMGGECSKIYVLEFGYITIPMMSLTIFIVLILMFIASKRKIRTSNLV